MSDLGFLLGALVVLAILVAIGHGIWLLVALIFRLIFGPGANPKAAQEIQQTPAPPPPRPVAETREIRLRRLQSEVLAMRNAGQIEAERSSRILAEFEMELKPAGNLEAPTTAPAPVVAPVHEPKTSAMPPPLPARKSPPPLLPVVDIARPTPTPPPEPPIDVLPKPSLAESLGSFMESRHIRWGELTGGLLILFCSVALVVSFWSQIAAIPMLQFALFLAATAAIFGAGIFVHRFWKLPATSKGFLVTGMLLVPLNAVAIAAAVRGTGSGGVQGMLLVFLACAVFGVLLWFGGRILSPTNAAFLLLGILFPSVISMIAGLTQPAANLAGWIAVLTVAPGALIAARFSGRDEEMTADLAERRLTELGFLFFSVLPTFWLVFFRGGGDFHALAPSFVLLGVMPMACGLSLFQKTEKLGDVWRLISLSLAIFGAALQFIALWIAAPQPAEIAVASGLSSLVGLWLIFRWRMAWARLQAMSMLSICAIAVGVLLSGKAGDGNWLNLISAALTTWHAVAACVLTLVCGLLWFEIRKPNADMLGRLENLWMIGIALFGGVAALSAGQFDETLRLGMFGASAIIFGALFRAGRRTGSVLFDIAACAIVLMMAFAAASWLPQGLSPITMVECLLVSATFLTLLGWVLSLEASKCYRIAAIAVGVLVLPFLFYSTLGSISWESFAYSVWSAGLLLCLALMQKSRLLLTLAELLILIAFRVHGSLYMPGLVSQETEPVLVSAASLGLGAVFILLVHAFVLKRLVSGKEMVQTRRVKTEELAMAVGAGLFCIYQINFVLSHTGMLALNWHFPGSAAVLGIAALLLLGPILRYLVNPVREYLSPSMFVLWFTAPTVAFLFPGEYLGNLQWTIACVHLLASVLAWAASQSKSNVDLSVRIYASIYWIGIPWITATAFIYWFGLDTHITRNSWIAFGPFIAMAGTQFLQGMLRRQNPPLLFAALMMHFGLTSYLIAESRPISEPSPLLLAYWNAAMCGLFSMLWAALPSIMRPRFSTDKSRTRRSYLYAGLTVLLVAGTVGVVWIFLEPWDVDTDFAYAASPAGWASVLFICLAWLAIDWKDGIRSQLSRLGIPAFVAVEHVGAFYQARIGWDGLSALAIGFAAATFVPLAAGVAGKGFPGVMEERFGLKLLAISIRGWMKFFALLSVACCCRVLFTAAAPGWLTVSIALLLCSVAFDLLSFQQANVRYLLFGAFFLNCGATLWWVDEGAAQIGVFEQTLAWDSLSLNLALLVIPGICSLIMERKLAGAASLHAFTGYLASVTFFIAAGWNFLGRSFHGELLFTPWIAVTGILVTGAILVGSLFWSSFKREALRALQFLGLAFAFYVSASIEPFGVWNNLCAVGILSIFAFCSAFGAAKVVGPEGDGWTRRMIGGVAVVSALLATGISFTFSAEIAGIPLWLAIFLRGISALALLTHLAAYKSAGGKAGGIAIGFITILLISWAPIEPGSGWDLTLNRLVSSVALLSLVGWILHGMNETAASRLRIRRPGYPAAVYSACALGFSLVVPILELLQPGPPERFISTWAIFLFFSILLIQSAMLVVLAVRPSISAWKIPPEKLTIPIYLAEALILLAGLHLRLAAPWLFSGILDRFWPFAAIGIAFVSFGISEWCERRRLPQVSGPLGRTSIFLPIIPALSYWGTAADAHYPFLMFIVGLFYSTLSMARRSFGFALLAAIAGNMALWTLLHRSDGFGFFEHPQMWLLPAAGSVLAALYWQRKQLPAAAFRTSRMLCVAIIYVSSTVDLFLNAATNSFWLPVILGALSIAGIFTGIALKVRSFLYLGLVFLIVDLFAVVLRATQNLGWTWLWYVIGIGAGCGLLVLFGVIEKNKDRFRILLDRLRAWD